MEKILVANRGEIALRILRTCREMGLPSVAVYTDVDERALHARMADEAVAIGGKGAYMDIDVIIRTARQTGATIVHPGYGFLAENPEFAQAVEDAGLKFAGPRAETIALMGDKLAARKTAKDAGLPVLPGSDNPLPQEGPIEMAEHLPFPLLVKATAGGGGRGIRLAVSREELPDVIRAARQEALAAFGDDSVYLESMVQQARHVEVQIIGDGAGNVLCLGERECSIQRRRQKLIEEAPAPDLRADMRKKLYEAALRLGKQLNYRGLGTVEFLLDGHGQFFFIEVNPRIQVEHPVTEMVTGLDLVREQLLIAMGEPLRLKPHQVEMRGSAIEARVLAEDSAAGFIPSTGTISYLKESGGLGVRIDSAVYQGMEIGVEYDSLIAKVITWGENRTTAIQRMRRALNEYQLGGVATDLEFLLQVINSAQFIAGSVTTTYLESFQPTAVVDDLEMERELAIAAAIYAQQQQNQAERVSAPRESGWLTTAWREQMRGS